jgi:hypothetical protein
VKQSSNQREAFVVAAAVVVIGCVVVLFAPSAVRHNAPLGVSRTIDSGRGIAVRGGYVEPNYDEFDRLDLDIRVYDPDATYDFVVHVRPAGPDEPDIRTVALRLDRDKIWHEKGAFEDPYVTVRFPAISDSANQRYYVWVEAGPRNRDDVWTLWRIKSFSTVPAWQVVKAWIASAPPPLGKWPGGVAIVMLLIASAGSLAWLFGAL